MTSTAASRADIIWRTTQAGGVEGRMEAGQIFTWLAAEAFLGGTEDLGDIVTMVFESSDSG